MFRNTMTSYSKQSKIGCMIKMQFLGLIDGISVCRDFVLKYTCLSCWTELQSLCGQKNNVNTI